MIADQGKLAGPHLINLEGATEVATLIGSGAFPLQVDITSPSSVQSAVEKVLVQSSRIDVLVNNAGVAGKAAPIWDQTDDDWSKVSGG